jgi:hypothetical protein
LLRWFRAEGINDARVQSTDGRDWRAFGRRGSVRAGPRGRRSVRGAAL